MSGAGGGASYAFMLVLATKVLSLFKELKKTQDNSRQLKATQGNSHYLTQFTQIVGAYQYSKTFLFRSSILLSSQEMFFPKSEFLFISAGGVLICNVS